jgi:hypothetical protein
MFAGLFIVMVARFGPKEIQAKEQHFTLVYLGSNLKLKKNR